MDNYVNATHSFMNKMGWTEMAAIGTRNLAYTAYLAHLNTTQLHVQEHLLQNQSEIWSKLQLIQSSYLKVIYVDVDLRTYHQIMCEALKLDVS